MDHFTNEAVLLHFANEALLSGVSRSDLVHLVGPELFTKTPSLTTRVYIDKFYLLLQVLHDVGYQKKRELIQTSQTFPENDIHHAYFSNAPDMETLLKQYIAMIQHQSSSISTETQFSGKITRVYIDFIDNKAKFYVPQGIHMMFSMLARNILELTTDQEKNFISGFTQTQLPDEDTFSKLATCQVKTNEERAYIQFPTVFMAVKNKNHNPLISKFLNQQYQQAYGVNPDGDKLLTTISSHLSASWAQGNVAPNIDHVAEKLGMSRSKLYRELTQRNITFSSIVESQRKHYAMMHIKNRDTSIAEISDRLGYANVSAFTRAFNRWFNTNPSKMRQ